MEEEMRKIEEEFAFQEKWIKILKRGKFFFQNIPEHLILKIITKMETKVFFNLLRTGKWMHILCRENRDSLLIPFEISNYNNHYVTPSNHYRHCVQKRPEVIKKERNQDIQHLRKIIRSKYYFFVWDKWDGNFMPLLEDLYSKEACHFRRECLNIGILRIDRFPINSSIINHLQPTVIEILMKQNGPVSENFNIPARTKDFFVTYGNISDSDFYKEIERFGSLPLKATFKREGYLELDELFSILMGVTLERHLHHPLQFLTYKRESRTKYKIFKFWPMDFFLPLNGLFYFIIVAKSDVGVSVIHLYQFARNGSDQSYTLQIMGIKSFDEWEKFTKREILDKHFNLEAGETYEKSDKQLAGILEVFSTQIASKFFEGVYPPLAPPELVEFLKEFEDFDIQPDKLAPHKPKWKKTEKLPDLPRKLPEIHSNNWLAEAKEVIKLRKFWMDFLQKKKFILELLPEKNVPDIAKRMKMTAYTNFLRTSKWIYELLKSKRLDNEDWRNHGGTVAISSYQDFDKSEDFEKDLSSLRFFHLDCLKFEYFKDEIDLFKSVLLCFGKQKIRTKEVYLWGCPFIKEIFISLQPEILSICVIDFKEEELDFKLPASLKQIVLDDIQQLGQIKLLQSLIGGRLDVLIKAYRRGNFNEGLSECFKNLKAKKCSNNVTIRTDYQENAYAVEMFSLSGISESVFVFRSMARGRVGQWNYFIRMESAGEGAVGVALFDFERVETFVDVKCEYFPTMESFLDYFEREVGSKRRTRDWMQLRKKDETIESREEDFRIYNGITPPYIQFNEQ